MKELVFETAKLDENEYVAFTQGVLDTLDKLGITVEWDEASPDLAQYKVCFEHDIDLRKN